MRWSVFAAALYFQMCAAPLARAQNPHIASTPPLAPEEQVKKFRLPPGFVIELVAVEPEINKPINIAFDALGRLWVTGSVEYPFPAEEGKKPRDTVKILSDFAPNGRARKVTVFADGLNIPIGVLPLADCKSALVYSIPNIYRMTDKDGDGKADVREIAYSQYGFKDTHGMTGEFMQGFDGWIYCCHGFSNTSKVKSKGDTAIQMQSGNTYRIKADGSRIEQVTWGQVNPFGLAFDPLGNLYSADCHTRPVYQLLKGAYYPSFGKPHDGLGFGPEMVKHDHGSTAIAGIAYYAAQQFPPEFRDNVFIGNVVTNRINRDRIEWHGSTPRGIAMPDFVTCEDPWFRPVDIKLGPDGALYVADFYNRIIGHYEVPLNHPLRDREKGRIWRIRYVGDKQTPVVKSKSPAEASPAELVGLLGSDNLTVRLQAAEQLVERGGKASVPLVRAAVAEGSTLQQAHGLWVLERLGALDDKMLASALRHKDRLVRVHAVKILGERDRWSNGERERVLAALKDADAFVRRAAADALAAHPTPDNVVPLIALRNSVATDDTHLLHAVRMALRNQLRLKETWAKLAVRDLSREEQSVVADVIPGVHSAESVEFLKDFVVLTDPSAGTLVRHARYMARHGKEGTAVWLLSHVRQKHPKDLTNQAEVLKAVQQGMQERGESLGKAATAFAHDLALELLSNDARDLQMGVDLVAAFKLDGLAQPLFTRVVSNRKLPEQLRKSAVAALVSVQPKLYVLDLFLILQDPAEELAVREQVAASLALTQQALAFKSLLTALESSPARVQQAIALALAGSQQGGNLLLDTVSKGKASARLLQDKGIMTRLRQAGVANADKRVAELTKGLQPADQRVQELIGKKKLDYQKASGTATAGLKIFQKHCAACHQIANQGAKIGPQLDGIGIRGVERLLEDILDPSRNVDQAFRATTLVLDNGQLVTGLFLRQDGEVFVLADKEGKEVRVPAKQVAERLVTGLSPMPGNFAELVPAQEFNDLLAYLLAQKVK